MTQVDSSTLAPASSAPAGSTTGVTTEITTESNTADPKPLHTAPQRGHELLQQPHLHESPQSQLLTDPAFDTHAPFDSLAFTDVPDHLSQIPFASSTSTTPANVRPASSASSANSSLPLTRPLSRSQSQTRSLQQSDIASAIRKTSPSVAERLKALGFGSSKKIPPATDASPPSSNSIGRLNEDQLRRLDENHQAGSRSSVIVRRGRPWKGAGATFPFLTTAGSVSAEDQAPGDLSSEPPLPDLPPEPAPTLPEITTPEPLAMDTQKYRLPDHENGNGIKATPEIRREHIERETRPASVVETSNDSNNDTDNETPPPPPPKETPAVVTPPASTGSDGYTPGLGSYFSPGQNRPGSIYTLSRASFANQLAQLTSLQLPDAESLSSKVSAIPTAQVAAKALINAAEQIRSWISKASEVIGGLDSEDDVEWSAAGGREGLDEVEKAILRFEELINVYVGAIEELQERADIANVAANDLKHAVSQMESIISEWDSIRRTLQNVRGQVEIAMEWEELWNNVLGDIQTEMDELARLVFEMEERRHKSIAVAAGADNVDIGDLETIVEDTPPPSARLQAPGRMGLPPFPMTPGSPGTPGTPGLSHDDSSLLALFARMQPLRASLDFLPMRLSVFQTRAEKSFPTACDELEMRRAGLDATYKKLEKDAESLRKELGEDRWVIVFRGAGRQAQKMHDSVERSLLKLREAMDAETHPQPANQPALMKKLENYEAKKTHYGPAIERVLSIINKGVKDRLTVNGEILRLDQDLQSRWSSLRTQIAETDAAVDELHLDRRGQHLRDSVSSMLSNDRSTIGSGHDTPQSSPPSSEIMSSLGFDPYTPVAKASKTRSSSTHSNVPSNRRQSSLPAPTAHSATSRRLVPSRLSTMAGPSTATPVRGSNIQRPNSTLGNRPAWNSSTNGIDTGHNFKPLSLTTPSPYARRTPVTQRSSSSLTPASNSKLPQPRSPLARAVSESPQAHETPTRTGHSRLSFRERLASPGGVPPGPAKPSLFSQSTNSSLSSIRRSSYQPPRAMSAAADHEAGRPASSLDQPSRRAGGLPLTRDRRGSSIGRASPLPEAGSRLANRKKTEPVDNRPRWRH